MRRYFWDYGNVQEPFHWRQKLTITQYSGKDQTKCLIIHLNMLNSDISKPPFSIAQLKLDSKTNSMSSSLRLYDTGWKYFAIIYLPQAFPYENPLSCNSMLLELRSLLRFFCCQYSPHSQSQTSFPFPPADNGTASSFEKMKRFTVQIIRNFFLNADVSSDVSFF